MVVAITTLGRLRCSIHTQAMASLRNTSTRPPRSRDRLADTAVTFVVYREGRGCQPVRVKPRIRYCQTPAGRVAYSTAGDGPPLLFDSGWITDLRGQLELLSFS